MCDITHTMSERCDCKEKVHELRTKGEKKQGIRVRDCCAIVCQSEDGVPRFPFSFNLINKMDTQQSIMSDCTIDTDTPKNREKH